MSIRLVSRMIVVGALLVWAASAAQGVPVFQYSFPASWDGTATAVTDLSSAGNNGVANAGAALSDTIPTGAPAGTKSLKVNTGTAADQRGGIGTSNLALLNNAAIAAAGGFQYDLAFLWDGTTHTTWAGVQKVMDYAGTESLQLENADGTAGTANLRFIFTADDPVGPDITTGPSIPVLANTWYQVSAVFDTQGNVVDGGGSLAGLATLTVTPIGGSPVDASVAVTKTTYGDGLNRAISVGAWAGNSDSVYLHGLVYDPAVSLVPEPATLALMGLGLAAASRLRRRR